MARQLRVGRVGRIVLGLDVEHSVLEAVVDEPGKSASVIGCPVPYRDGSGRWR